MHSPLVKEKFIRKRPERKMSDIKMFTLAAEKLYIFY